MFTDTVIVLTRSKVELIIDWMLPINTGFEFLGSTLSHVHTQTQTTHVLASLSLPFHSKPLLLSLLL